MMAPTSGQKWRHDMDPQMFLTLLHDANKNVLHHCPGAQFYVASYPCAAALAPLPRGYRTPTTWSFIFNWRGPPVPEPRGKKGGEGKKGKEGEVKKDINHHEHSNNGRFGEEGEVEEGKEHKVQQTVYQLWNREKGFLDEPLRNKHPWLECHVIDINKVTRGLDAAIKIAHEHGFKGRVYNVDLRQPLPPLEPLLMPPMYIMTMGPSRKKMCRVCVGVDKDDEGVLNHESLSGPKFKCPQPRDDDHLQGEVAKAQERVQQLGDCKGSTFYGGVFDPNDASWTFNFLCLEFGVPSNKGAKITPDGEPELVESFKPEFAQPIADLSQLEVSVNDAKRKVRRQYPAADLDGEMKLYYPAFPGVSEPQYEWDLQGCRVFVGTKTGALTSFPLRPQFRCPHQRDPDPHLKSKWEPKSEPGPEQGPSLSPGADYDDGYCDNYDEDEYDDYDDRYGRRYDGYGGGYHGFGGGYGFY